MSGFDLRLLLVTGLGLGFVFGFLAGFTATSWPSDAEAVGVATATPSASRVPPAAAVLTPTPVASSTPEVPPSVSRTVPPRAARTQPSRPARSLGVLDVTAYCATGSRTASGVWPAAGQVATLDRAIPFGTLLTIDGLGTFTVTDRVGSGSDVDVFMGGPGCRQRALAFGRHHLGVTVTRWGR